MIKAIVCLFATIIAVAIPAVCACSFILGWGALAKALLTLATIFDGGLIMDVLFLEVNDGQT